jgi:hypothetical protein
MKIRPERVPQHTHSESIAFPVDVAEATFSKQISSRESP